MRSCGKGSTCQPEILADKAEVPLGRTPPPRGHVTHIGPLRRFFPLPAYSGSLGVEAHKEELRQQVMLYSERCVIISVSCHLKQLSADLEGGGLRCSAFGNISEATYHDKRSGTRPLERPPPSPWLLHDGISA